MTALDHQIINRRLNKLQQIIDKLTTEQPASADDLAELDVLGDATLYRMQVGIEAIIDIGSHILAEHFKQHADTYRDVILELGKHGVVPDEFAKANAEMADFRNLLVHHYVELDPQKAFANIEKAPAIFRSFATHFVAFLEKQETS